MRMWGLKLCLTTVFHYIWGDSVSGVPSILAEKRSFLGDQMFFFVNKTFDLATPHHTDTL